MNEIILKNQLEAMERMARMAPTKELQSQAKEQKILVKRQLKNLKEGLIINE